LATMGPLEVRLEQMLDEGTADRLVLLLEVIPLRSDPGRVAALKGLHSWPIRWVTRPTVYVFTLSGTVRQEGGRERGGGGERERQTERERERERERGGGGEDLCHLRLIM
jgi:hypothetical protein